MIYTIQKFNFMLFLERFSIKSMTTTLKCPNWAQQPGFLVNAFGGVRIMLARVFSEVGKWDILILGIDDNPRITINACTPDEVIDKVRQKYSL